MGPSRRCAAEQPVRFLCKPWQARSEDRGRLAVSSDAPRSRPQCTPAGNELQVADTNAAKLATEGRFTARSQVEFLSCSHLQVVACYQYHCKGNPGPCIPHPYTPLPSLALSYFSLHLQSPHSASNASYMQKSPGSPFFLSRFFESFLLRIPFSLFLHPPLSPGALASVILLLFLKYGFMSEGYCQSLVVLKCEIYNKVAFLYIAIKKLYTKLKDSDKKSYLQSRLSS